MHRENWIYHPWWGLGQCLSICAITLSSPGDTLAADVWRLTVTMTPDPVGWAVSQQPVIILHPGKTRVALGSWDPIWPPSANNVLHNHSSSAKTNLIFLLDIGLLILWLRDASLIISYLSHISIFHSHHWRLEDVMKDTNETNQCHPDQCPDVTKMTRIIINQKRFPQSFRWKDVTVVTISNNLCSAAVVIVHHFDLFLELSTNW